MEQQLVQPNSKQIIEMQNIYNQKSEVKLNKPQDILFSSNSTSIINNIHKQFKYMQNFIVDLKNNCNEMLQQQTDQTLYTNTSSQEDSIDRDKCIKMTMQELVAKNRVQYLNRHNLDTVGIISGYMEVIIENINKLPLESSNELQELLKNHPIKLFWKHEDTNYGNSNYPFDAINQLFNDIELFKEKINKLCKQLECEFGIRN